MSNRVALFVMVAALLSTGMSCTERTAQPPVAPIAGSGGGATEPARDDTGVFNVRLKTTKGDVVIEVHPAWAPVGAARFRELVEAGFYSDCALFRVVPGFVVQWGINGDPAVHAKWKDRTLVDEPVLKSNQRGYVTFAKGSAPDTRSTQVFINFGDNARLERQYAGFAPFAVVTEGMENVDAFYKGYGEAPSKQQEQIVYGGNDFLRSSYPMLDYIISASVEEPGSPQPATSETPAGS